MKSSRLSLLTASLLLFPACSLDTSEFRVDPAGGVSGQGGSAGSGGTAAGTGGSSGASGQSGKAGAPVGGQAGQGGASGTGGTAGTSGTAGAGGTGGKAGSSGTGGTAGQGGTAGKAGAGGLGGGAGSGGGCAEGLRSCDGDVPQQCMGGVQVPGNACAAGLCKDGGCLECAEGTLPTCNVDTPVTCTDGKLLNGDACKMGLCKDGACLECGPSEVRCSGDQPQVCDGSGKFTANGDACKVGLCKEGVCLGCNPGSVTCSGDQPQVCNASGVFESSGTACGAGLCKDGACVKCVPSSTYCNGDVLTQCDATGNSPSVLATCQPGGCDPALKLCTECTPGGGDTCSGQLLQSCTDYGTLTTKKTCAAGTTCNASNVDNPCELCSPAQYSCTPGGVLQQCNANGDAYASSLPCATPALCNAAEQRCDKCQSGTFECNGATLRACDPAIGYVDKDTCASPALCNKTTGVCEAASCTIGTVRCSGKNIQKCNDGATYTTQSTCLSSELCDVSNNAGDCLTPTLVATGDHHSCARMSNGTAMCWGDNTYGQLGSNVTSGTYPIPQPVLLQDGKTRLANIVTLAAGENHTCALVSDGKVFCWGKGDTGQLGTVAPISGSRPYAAQVSGVTLYLFTSDVQSLAAGGDSTCAVTNSSGLHCWGGNSRGQLGNGSFDNKFTPTVVTGLSSGVSGVSVGAEHACAVLSTGQVRCWGESSEGQLGIGYLPASKQLATPQTVVINTTSPYTPLTSVTAIAAGGYYTKGKCNPFPCTPTSYPHGHSCAVANGKVLCWGSNYDGELGISSNLNKPNATLLAGPASFTSLIGVTTGGQHSCAWKSGSLFCWGSNTSIETGTTAISTSTDTLSPALVSSLSPSKSVLSVDSTNRHTCTISSEKAVCWGSNYNGQLGDGATSSAKPPVEVVFP